MTQHCFLLDGKAIFPIDHNHQLFIPLKLINNIKNKYCSCYQSHSQSYLFKYHHSLNNKHCQVDEKDFSSCSVESIRKLFEDKYFKQNKSLHKIMFSKRKNSKHDRFNKQMNNNNNTETCSNQSHKSSSPMTIIIKPFMSSKSHYKHRKDICLNNKLSSNKRKNSLSQKTSNKRVSTSLSDHIQNKHRLSTFKDIRRPIISNKSVISLNANINQSKTLYNIYCNKKQHLLEK
ncbi:unnamed protein product [Adineta steineri]|uniref:Uncharacterized protein n=1 Tax=Adineta steineri TaxID=433720 RepID=A0A813ZB18_9BILA|nr:unnamed protein product [Adineta steineri]CAF3610624.1 unnamed protein product [Adineta steineri]